ncbi:MAG: TolC family protein [Pseudomonadota bacterium]
MWPWNGVRGFIVLFGAGGMLMAAEAARAVAVTDIPGLVRVSNRDVMVASTEIESAENEIKIARARYLPNIELKSTYTRLDKDVVLDIPSQRIEKQILNGSVTIGLDVDPPPVEIQKKDMMMSNLVLTQPLFTGGRITAGLDAAEAGLNIARAEAEQTYRERLAESLIRYFQVQLAGDVLTTLRKIELELNNIAATAEAAVKTGAVAKFATMQIKVAQVDLSARIKEAEASQKLATLAFKDSIGFDAMQTASFDSPLLKVDMKHGLDVFKTKALSERTEFKILDAKGTQVAALKSAKAGEMLPTMFLFGTYNVARENLPIFTPKWAAGVGLNVPITAGLTQVPEMRRAAQLAAKVEILRAKARAQIPLQVEQLFDHCQALRGALETLEANQGLAAEVQRLAEARFKAGTGSAVEVLKANADNQTAQVRRLMLLEEYNRHLIELFQASGSVDYYVASYQDAQKSRG